MRLIEGLLCMTKNIQVHCLQYKEASDSLQKEFLRLIRSVWPYFSHCRIHNLDLSPVSFFVCVNQRVVSYCAVLSKKLAHAHNQYQAAGLSCACTQAEYRKQGYGSLVVKTATQFIENSKVDIGLFTCDTELLFFYEKQGWLLATDVSIIAGEYPGALSSKAYHKAVLLRLFSPKALRDRDFFHHAVINLSLPPGECW